ncbi:MAG: prepilin-type N-terminal cleavage/methylation domain-containing protein, partial [Candidatus Omnitrophica bacterium]|nr:prepilin-type N-terminal cleavage/methylation domain-containing protein [Candidatus Omnitrophota bacterium]
YFYIITEATSAVQQEVIINKTDRIQKEAAPMRKGFTLLELIIVIIIIGILASLGFIQYTKTLEKSRSGEAKQILGQIRSAQITYYQEYNAFATAMNNLYVNAPTTCTATHYFSYDPNETGGFINASRCTGSGKTPDVASADSYFIRINVNYGNWSGTEGYY